MEKSAWGIDFHDKQCLVAISDNARAITIFRLGIKDALDRWDRGKALRDSARKRQESEDFGGVYEAGVESSSLSSQSGKRVRGDENRQSAASGRRTTDFMQTKIIIAEAHDNNIPCVQCLDVPLRTHDGQTISQPCILSTSIDGDVKLWDLATKECIAGAAFPNKKGWNIKALWLHNFLNVDDSNIISSVNRDIFSMTNPATHSKLEPPPGLVVSFPIKSRNPFMNVIIRHWQRPISQREVYERTEMPMLEFELEIDPSTRPKLFSQERLDAEFLGLPVSELPATPSSYMLHPIMTHEQRHEKYIINDLVIYHGSLHQSRLIGFQPDTSGEYLANICPTVFGSRTDYEKFTASCDRLNMALTIPELACVIAGSQQGTVSVFKCCRVEETGELGIKQEYVLGEANRRGGSNTMIGMGAFKVETQSDNYDRRYLLFLVFINGTVETYEIKRAKSTTIADDILDVEELIF